MLVDANLSGLLVGMTLATTAGDIYRALIEATAFSTRRILDAFEEERIPVKELIAVGGLAERSPLLLQIYADVTRRPDRPGGGGQRLGPRRRDAGSGRGRDRPRGGHASFADAARAMARLKPERVAPDPTRADAYDALYRDWLELHDHFGKKTDLMRRLKTGVRSENSAFRSRKLRRMQA